MIQISKKLKLFKKIDIFGAPINLKLKEDDTFKTIFGGLVTSLLVSFFLVAIAYSFYLLFTKQDRGTQKYDLNLGSSFGFLELKKENFMLAIKLNQDILNNWENPYMNITLLHVTQFRNSSGAWKIKNKVLLRPCQITDFIGLENDFFQMEANKALCPKSEDFNLTMQGNYQEDVFAYFQISITSCSDILICQTNETIYKAISSLDKLRVQFLIINNIVDEMNFENPIKREIISDIHFLIDPINPVYRTADIFLNEVEITTDTGYTPTMFKTIIPNKTYSYNQEFREQTVFSLSGSQKNNIADFFFRKSQTKYIYNRFLGNILTILSYLGGIWSTCFFSCKIILQVYNRYSLLNALANKLYNYPSQKKIKNNLDCKNSSNINNNENKDKSLNISNMSPKTISKYVYSKIRNKIESYLSYEQKLSFGFFGMWKFIFQNLFSFFHFKEEKYKLMKQGKRNIKNDLDICIILQKLHELDKIKNLLFSEDQLVLLSFSPKPEIINNDLSSSEIKNKKSLSKITLQSERGSLLQKQISFNNIRPFERLILSWKNLKEMQEKSLRINDNLLKMFDEHFKKTIGISEKEIQIFCEQSLKMRKSSSSFINSKDKTKSSDFIKGIKRTDEKNIKMTKTLSENFIECDEEIANNEPEKKIETNDSLKFLSQISLQQMKKKSICNRNMRITSIADENINLQGEIRIELNKNLTKEEFGSQIELIKITHK